MNENKINSEVSGDPYWDERDEEEKRKKIEEERKQDPTPITWTDLNKKSFTEAQYRINNLIPREGFAFLASISGEGKTWLALEMAKSIIAGKDFLDNPEFKTIGGNCLYINGEMSESELQRRGRLLKVQEGNHKLYLTSHDGLNLNSKEGVVDRHFSWLEWMIKQYEISVVFIDTFRAVAGGLKEEKAEEVRAFMDKFKPLKNKGVAVVFLEHCRKPAQFEGKIPKKEHLFGSQDKTASVEILLMIKNDEDTGEIAVYQRKNRLGPEVDPFKVIMQDEFDDNGEDSIKIKYIGKIEDAESQKDVAMEEILKLLEQGPNMTVKDITGLLSKKVGSKNIRGALNSLAEQKKIEYGLRGKAREYYIPKKEEEEKGVVSPDGDNF